MATKCLCYAGAAGNDVENSSRNTSFKSQLTKFQRAERSFNRWLEDDCVTCSESGTNFPGGHHEGIVPGSQRGNYADRFTTNDAGMSSSIFTRGCTGKVASSTRKEVQVVDGKRNITIAR